MPLRAEQLQRYYDAALEIMQTARVVILDRMLAGFASQLKPDHTWVTDVDLAVETALRAEIQRRFPEHGLIGEEYEPVKPNSEFLWTIDPIDGTMNFRHRVPLFGSILALMYQGRPVVGVIDHAALRITCSAASGLGTYCNGERVQCPPAAENIEEELIATGGREQFVRSGHARFFDRLFQVHPCVRTYCDCFGHTLAIRGAVGAMVDFDLHLWDIAASEVLAQEAGCAFVYVRKTGSPDRHATCDVVFGKPQVVEWVLALQREVS